MPHPLPVHIEWHCQHAGTIRVFPVGNNLGDPYLWAATVKRITEDTVEILGVTQAPTHVVSRAIAGHLARAGFATLVIERHRPDKTIQRVTHDIRRCAGW